MIDFKNKKITVMGLGQYENGSGIAATKFLVSQGAKVLVTDLKSARELAEQIKRLGVWQKKVKLVLGRHREADFKNVDLVVRNPGVPKSSKFLKIAKSNKIPIVNDISLFFDIFNRKKIIGVTGTRGKSTTASLIYKIFQSVNKNAILGGNITKSPLAQLPKIKPDSLVVLELSSWLLEEQSQCPYIAVVTNIYPDHLNTYENMADYIRAKENIWRWQNAQDAVILNRDNKYTCLMGGRVPARRFWFSGNEFEKENGCFVRGRSVWFRENGTEKKVLSVDDIKLLGRHNLENVLAAVCVGMVYGVAPAKIKKIVVSFKGIADRLELIQEMRGVKYYNDTTSTTPEATTAALQALGKNIILILGGADKGLNMSKLIPEIKKYCKAVVLLPGTGTDKMRKLLVTHCPLPVTFTKSMIEAVGVAQSLAKKGDAVLLSPAFASFGLFKNEFDRGEQFKDAVRSIKKLKHKNIKI